MRSEAHSHHGAAGHTLSHPAPPHSSSRCPHSPGGRPGNGSACWGAGQEEAGGPAKWYLREGSHHQTCWAECLRALLGNTDRGPQTGLALTRSSWQGSPEPALWGYTAVCALLPTQLRDLPARVARRQRLDSRGSSLAGKTQGHLRKKPVNVLGSGRSRACPRVLVRGQSNEGQDGVKGVN